MSQIRNLNTEVLVVGGGIGGLSAALALSKINIQVTVIEQASEFTEIQQTTKERENMMGSTAVLPTAPPGTPKACTTTTVRATSPTSATGKRFQQLMLADAEQRKKKSRR